MYRQRVCLLMAWMCAVPCFAEDSDISNTDLEEVTVTAHRIETQSIVPVETLNKEEIAQRLSMLGPDVLAPMTSLAVSRAGAYGSQAQIRVRGAEANHLQVLVDGIEVNDPATGSEFAFAHLDLAGIGRIEFLPGAQSALWGSDALAGVLHLLSSQESDLRILELASGSNGERLGRVDFGDVLTQGQYRLTVSHYATRGTNTSLEGDEDDGYEHDSMHFSGRIQRENTGLSLVLRRVDALSEFDPTGFPTFLPVDGDSESSATFQAAKIAIDGTFLNERWKQMFEFKHIDTRTLTDSNGSRISRFEGARNTLTSLSHLFLSAGQGVTGLIEYEDQGFRQAAEASFFGDPNYAVTVNTKSAAVEHLADWRRLSSSLSARYDTHSDFEHIISYRALLRYRVRPSLSIFASLGTGTKNPSFIERFGYTPDSFIGNPDLRPEYNRHSSLGVNVCVSGSMGVLSGGAKHSMGVLSGNHRCGKDSMGVLFVLFQDVLKDEINGFAWSGKGFTAVNLDEESKRRGIELQVNAQVAETALKAGYTFVDSNSPDGTREIRRPRHQAHVSLKRGLIGDKLELLLGARLTSENLDLDFSTGQQRVVKLPGRQLFYFTARYDLSEKLDIHLKLENLFDDHGQEVYGFAPPGRRVSVGFQVHW